MIREEILQIVSQVLDVPLSEIDENSSTQTLEKWDSLNHMNLILALEEKFRIRFHEDQIMHLSNVGLIISAIKELKNEN